MDGIYQVLLAGDAPWTPADALRATQRALRAEPGYADPNFWDAFAAYGDWR